MGGVQPSSVRKSLSPCPLRTTCVFGLSVSKRRAVSDLFGLRSIGRQTRTLTGAKMTNGSRAGRPGSRSKASGQTQTRSGQQGLYGRIGGKCVPTETPVFGSRKLNL